MGSGSGQKFRILRIQNAYFNPDRIRPEVSDPSGSGTAITYLGIILLCLELQLNVEQGNLGILVGLALHLESGIAEGLLEGDAGDENGVLQGAALHLLDPDHVEGQEVVQHHDGVHDHLAEELLLLVDELAGHGGGGALLQQGPVFLEKKKNQ